MSIWKLSQAAEEDARVLRGYERNPPLIFRVKRTCALIDRLAATGEPAAIPSVASGLFSSSRTIHVTASFGVAKLLRLTSSIELIRLNEILGGCYYGYVSERWDGITPQQVEACLGDANDVAVGKLLSLHRNGYVRQAAVRFLSNIESGGEIRFLLLRQNDWVDSISENAQVTIRDRLTDNNLAWFANESELLLHLLQFKRRDLSKCVSLFVDLLVAPKHAEHLIEAVKSCGKQAGRKLVELLLLRDGNHLADVVRFGVNSDDGVVRAKCLRRANECLPPEECTELSENLIKDKFIPVRLGAYELKAASSPDVSCDIWENGLLDKSRSIRETSMFHLGKAGCDVASIYREYLSRFPGSLPALSGLVASGDKTDLALFLQYLESPHASRRAEAIRGIGQVGIESSILCIQQALLDESTRVIRVAHQQLSAAGGRVDPGHLFGLIEDCKNLAGKKAILRLLMSLGRWPAISFLIRAAANDDESVAGFSKTLIDASFCMNRIFTQPSKPQRLEIQAAVDESAGLLADDWVIDLRSCLSSFGFSV